VLLSARLQAHFENVQRISDTTTLPFAMHYLRSRIIEELDISHLTERLLQGKGGDSAALTPKEKLDTWERIKILSTIDPGLSHHVASWLVISKHRAWIGIHVTNSLYMSRAIRFHKDSVFIVGDDIAELIC
jgi:hypothetical protein